MNISVFFERENKEQKVDFSGSTVKELLEFINVNQEEVLVVRNNEVITSDTVLSDNDSLMLLSVISGGWNEMPHL